MNFYDTNLVLAVRCANCGKIKFHNLSIFKLAQEGKINLKCDCGNNELGIKLNKNKKLLIDVPCLACDIIHTYIYELKDILKRRVSVICCNETDFELCFIGREKDVKDIVFRYQEDLNILLGELGFV